MSRFQLSQGIFGPTEIRILLIIGNLALLRSPYSTVFGHTMLLFDLGGAIAAVCMFATVIPSRFATPLSSTARSRCHDKTKGVHISAKAPQRCALPIFLLS